MFTSILIFFLSRAIYLGIASAISHGYERTRSCSLKKTNLNKKTKRNERAETAQTNKEDKSGVKRQ
jgi:hypothetical protein